jgi:hypothetical protein
LNIEASVSTVPPSGYRWQLIKKKGRATKVLKSDTADFVLSDRQNA